MVICREGQYLFAEFSRSSEVDVALELNEREIEGTKIRVQKATDESIPEDAERFLKESSIAKVRHFSVEQLDEVSRTIYVGGVSSEGLSHLFPQLDFSFLFLSFV